MQQPPSVISSCTGTCDAGGGRTARGLRKALAELLVDDPAFERFSFGLTNTASMRWSKEAELVSLRSGFSKQQV